MMHGQKNIKLVNNKNANEISRMIATL